MSNQLLYSIGGSNSSSFSTSKYPPNPVTNLLAEGKDTYVNLTWTDPEDLTLVDGTVIKWAYTRIVRKAGSVPENSNDGVVVVNNAIRNQYSITPFVDNNGLVVGTTYYYVAFSVSETGGINTEGPSVEASLTPYKIMTVIINEADSNPAMCCSYANDAVDMPSGKDATAWADFFGYKPCLFKDGQVVGYLNPNNYAQFEDGTPADITSGDAGDVMVEFPRRGVKISKSGNLVTVSMTDNPDDPDFTYYAHTRGESPRDYFYLGAYIADSNMNSLSGKSPLTSAPLGTTRSKAHMKGSGYEECTFYQITFIQVMYLLQFKNLNSSSQIGVGYYNGGGSSGHPDTGMGDQKGMIFGSSSQLHIVKLFGIEALWESLASVALEGLMYDESLNLYMSTDLFNNELDGYTKCGVIVLDNNDGYNDGFCTSVMGTSELGFIPDFSSGKTGSNTTYWCDYALLTTPATYYGNKCIFSIRSSDGNASGGLFAFEGRGLGEVRGVNTGRLSYY